MKETTAPLPGLCPLFLSFTKQYKAPQPKHNNLSKTLNVGSLHSCPWAFGLELLSRDSALFCTVVQLSLSVWTMNNADIFTLGLFLNWDSKVWALYQRPQHVPLVLWHLCKALELKKPSSAEEVSMQHSQTSTNKNTQLKFVTAVQTATVQQIVHQHDL